MFFILEFLFPVLPLEIVKISNSRLLNQKLLAIHIGWFSGTIDLVVLRFVTVVSIVLQFLTFLLCDPPATFSMLCYPSSWSTQPSGTA